jgi:alpha-glucosidase
MVIYQIYPRSFKDTNKDGIGDLAGVAEKIPYIASLGVDAIWISPFVQSPQKDFGYDVSDYCAVDPRFGTMQDFKRVLKRAHAHGLKVLMDQVWCHCSDKHPWFIESRQSRTNPKADWFVWTESKPDGGPPNNWVSYFGGSAWEWDTRRQQYYFHQFLSSQPTFNLRKKAVRQALLDVGRFWLEMGVDGFRLDAVHTGFADPKLRNNPPRPKGMPIAPDVPSTIPQARQIRLHSEAHADTLEFLEEMRRMTDAYGAVLLGEVSGEGPYARAALYTQGKTRLHMAYNFGLLKDRPDAALFRETVVYGEQHKNGGHFCYALSNHDVMRVASRWDAGTKGRRGGGKSVARAALMFGLTLPGTYCMYQGEELGLPQAEVPFEKLVDPFGIAFWPDFKGRDGCRTPFPWAKREKHGGFSQARDTWLPFYEPHRALAVDAQEADEDSMLHFTRDFLRWRKRQPALRGEDFAPVKTSGGVIAYWRGDKAQKFFCLFNFGEKPARFLLPPGVTPIPVFTNGAQMKGRRVQIAPLGGMICEARSSFPSP